MNAVDFTSAVNDSLRVDFNYMGPRFIRNTKDFKSRRVSFQGEDATTAAIARKKFHGTALVDIIVVYEIDNNPTEKKNFLQLRVVQQQEEVVGGREQEGGNGVRFNFKKVEPSLEGAKYIAQGLHRYYITDQDDVTSTVSLCPRDTAPRQNLRAGLASSSTGVTNSGPGSNQTGLSLETSTTDF